MNGTAPSEHDILPYHASPLPQASAVVVFAPHPDDEVFGCGGALALHARAGVSVHVVLLTEGEAGWHGAQPTSGAGNGRLAESAQAAQLLGIEAPQCWHLPDRGVVYGEELVERMMHEVRRQHADLVYAPSLWEAHPDHRAAAMAAAEAVRRVGGACRVCWMEISSALRPNLLLDVTSVWDAKLAAMQTFRSQNGHLPYPDYVAALNRFRSLTLNRDVKYAEAFELHDARDLAAGAYRLRESEASRLIARGHESDAAQLPLVSVIVRSIGRPTLARALASLQAQTYANWELVLVNASGPPLEVGAWPAERLRYVERGAALGRSAAANLGLEAARGEYLVFLDDDDWLYPDHIHKLVRALNGRPAAIAAHTVIECVDDDGRPTGVVFDTAYAPDELRYGNFLPIHSVLFRRRALDEGARFDEAFDIYEDWDFWLQVERGGPLVFVPGVSAAYRVASGSGMGVDVDAERAQTATRRVFEKWGTHWSERSFRDLIPRALAWRDYKRRERKLNQQEAQFREARAMVETLQHDLNQLRTDAHRFKQAHHLAMVARDDALSKLREVAVDNAAVREHARRVEAHAQGLEQHMAAREAQHVQERSQLELTLAEHRACQRQLEADTRQIRDEARVLTDELQRMRGSKTWRYTERMRRMWSALRGGGTAPRPAPAAASESVSQEPETLQPQGLVTARPDEPLPAPVVEPDRSYRAWVDAYDTLSTARIDQLRQRARALRTLPQFSIVMPVYNPAREHLEAAIASVRDQIYPGWELCICNDASTAAHVREVLDAAAAADPRVRVMHRETNGHIAQATNDAIGMARGEWIGFLDHDDVLRAHALLYVAEAMAKTPLARVFYSDEDKLDAQGVRFDPYFKSDFNLGLIRGHNYMCHFAVYQNELVSRLGGIRQGFDGAQDYDLALRAVDAVPAEAVVHIPHILYHWRVTPQSTAGGVGNKNYAWEAGQRALKEHLERRQVPGEVLEAPEAPGMYRVRYAVPEGPDAPLVSIIIPTRNGLALLRQCIESLGRTRYKRHEIVVVDNASDDPETIAYLAMLQAQGTVRALRDDSAFNFSAINNHAVRQAARGEFLLFMNNDIEAVDEDWLHEMLGPALEPGVGCVGARLWYPDGRLQHGGVILVCGVAGHAHKYLPRGAHGYMGRAVLAQDFMAVTAACLLLRRSIFEEVHGFDEGLAVAFNDVDFCLRVHQAGYRNVWTPFAQLIHHESVTRGYEDTPEKQARFKDEVRFMQSRWKGLLDHDPYYNPNLTQTSEDFSLGWPAADKKATN